MIQSPTPACTRNTFADSRKDNVNVYTNTDSNRIGIMQMKQDHSRSFTGYRHLTKRYMSLLSGLYGSCGNWPVSVSTNRAKGEQEPKHLHPRSPPRSIRAA